VETVMTKVIKLRKGIILLHDFQKYTGDALPTQLGPLKASGWLQGCANESQGVPVQTLAGYDAELVKDAKLPTISSRPVSSVVQTVGN
jgi:hypothetical protein